MCLFFVYLWCLYLICTQVLYTKPGKGSIKLSSASSYCLFESRSGSSCYLSIQIRKARKSHVDANIIVEILSYPILVCVRGNWFQLVHQWHHLGHNLIQSLTTALNTLTFTLGTCKKTWDDITWPLFFMTPQDHHKWHKFSEHHFWSMFSLEREKTTICCVPWGA